MLCSLRNSSGLALLIRSNHFDAASPPNFVIILGEVLAMCPGEQWRLGSLPDSIAIVRRKGCRFDPGNSILTDGSGASIASHPLLNRCVGQSACCELRGKLTQQLDNDIKKCFQDLMVPSLLGFEIQSQISAIGRGPISLTPSIAIEPSSLTCRWQVPPELGRG